MRMSNELAILLERQRIREELKKLSGDSLVMKDLQVYVRLMDVLVIIRNSQ